MTITKAIELGLRQSPTVLNQVQELKRTKGLVFQAQAALLPQLTNTASYSQNEPTLVATGSDPSQLHAEGRLIQSQRGPVIDQGGHPRGKPKQRSPHAPRGYQRNLSEHQWLTFDERYRSSPICFVHRLQALRRCRSIARFAAAGSCAANALMIF
jgi:hypothetical protein